MYDIDYGLMTHDNDSRQRLRIHDTIHDSDSNHDTIPDTIWHDSRVKETTLD